MGTAGTCGQSIPGIYNSPDSSVHQNTVKVRTQRSDVPGGIYWVGLLQAKFTLGTSLVCFNTCNVKPTHIFGDCIHRGWLHTCRSTA